MILTEYVAAGRCEGEGETSMQLDGHMRSNGSAAAWCGAGKGVVELWLAWHMGSGRCDAGRTACRQEHGVKPRLVLGLRPKWLMKSSRGTTTGKGARRGEVGRRPHNKRHGAAQVNLGIHLARKQSWP
jgi:hypothetical protein